MKLFYSWQSTIKGQKNGVEKSLNKALKKIKKDIQVDIALDRDTKNTTGSTDIADEILRKINTCSIFVADISFINTNWITNFLRITKYPNPNVLVELGYAVRKVGWDRIIMIFNKNFGELEELPFDLRHRRVLAFNDITKELENDFFSAIKPISELNESDLIPARDIEENHDINVFNKIMDGVTEDIFINQLNKISRCGFYDKSEISYLYAIQYEIGLPGSKFFNKNIQSAADNFGSSLSKLNSFLSIYFHNYDHQSKLMYLNKFENETDYNKKEQDREKLLGQLNDHANDVITKYINFRYSVKRILLI